MDITFDDDNGGTSDSTINVNFEITEGPTLAGSVNVFTGSATLQSLGSPWARTTLNTVEIPLINFHLNGANSAEDFFRGVLQGGIRAGCQPHGEISILPATHCIFPTIAAVIPTLSTWGLITFGLLLLGAMTWFVTQRARSQAA